MHLSHWMNMITSLLIQYPIIILYFIKLVFFYDEGYKEVPAKVEHLLTYLKSALKSFWNTKMKLEMKINIILHSKQKN